MADSVALLRIEGEVWWPVQRAADVLQVGCAHVRRLVKRAKLRSRRVTGRIWVAARDVERYAKERGMWRPGGVVGGKPAAEALGVAVGAAAGSGWGKRDAA